MPKTERNRVRERREARGLSQVALAAAAGLSRQSVGAIEAGRAMPAVDVAMRIAGALEARVEDLFGAPATEQTLATEPASASLTGRVAVAEIGGRWISYGLDGAGMRISADGLGGAARRDAVEVAPLRPAAEARDNVVLMGCAPGLGLLADRLNARPGPGRFLWFSRSSTEALEALARSRTHVAGVHLVDPRTREANVADVRRLAGTAPVVLITLGRWEAGLVLPRGNPRKLRAIADLGRRGLRIAVREPGSGARRFLDRELRSAGLSLDVARKAPVLAAGHLEVAHAVSLGAADAGVATRDAALAFGLDFVALEEERYDLALAAEGLADARLQRLLDVLTSAPLRRELSAVGYDVRGCGDRVANVS